MVLNFCKNHQFIFFKPRFNDLLNMLRMGLKIMQPTISWLPWVVISIIKQLRCFTSIWINLLRTYSLITWLNKVMLCFDMLGMLPTFTWIFYQAKLNFYLHSTRLDLTSIGIYADRWWFLLSSGFKKYRPDINVIYSTPSCYAKAVNEAAADLAFPVKTDDFFPYASGSHSYWTGYFTSRPNSKRFERQGNNMLQV